NHVYHGQPLDEINVREEAGDIEWYGAVLREAMGWTQAEVQEANVRKLRLRNGGDSFNAEANAERDTDAERAAIEHYADTNTTYVPVRAGTSADAHEVAPGVVVDYDAEGQVLGVTIERGTAIAAPNKA